MKNLDERVPLEPSESQRAGHFEMCSVLLCGNRMILFLIELLLRIKNGLFMTNHKRSAKCDYQNEARKYFPKNEIA